MSDLEDVFGDEQNDEDARIEVWKAQVFLRQGFDVEQMKTLLEWKVDPHETDYILFRKGKPTECTHELAMHIVTPLDVLDDALVA